MPDSGSATPVVWTHSSSVLLWKSMSPESILPPSPYDPTTGAERSTRIAVSDTATDDRPASGKYKQGSEFLHTLL